MPDGYFVQSTEQRVPIAEYLSACVDVEKFIGYCRACRNYGRRWSRPSFDFDPLDLWKPLSGHPYSRPRPDACERRGHGGHDGGAEAGEGKTDGCAAENGAGYAGQPCPLSRQLFPLRQLYPPEGIPCREPERMRYSIEALGGDLSETMERYFQRPHPLEQERRSAGLFDPGGRNCWWEEESCEGYLSDTKPDLYLPGAAIPRPPGSFADCPAGRIRGALRPLGLREEHPPAAAEAGSGAPRGSAAEPFSLRANCWRNWTSGRRASASASSSRARKTRWSPTRCGTSWPLGWRAWGTTRPPSAAIRISIRWPPSSASRPGFIKTSRSSPEGRSSF